MNYHPVVDRFAIPVPLDPLTATLFVAVFACSMLTAARRPAYAIAGLVLLMPFALAREIAGTTVTLPKAALLGIVAGLCAYPGVAARLRERPAPLLLAALGLYLGACALSGLAAAHSGAVVRETLKNLEYAGIFVAAFLCRRIDPDDVPIVSAAAIAAIVVSLGALAQEFVGAPSGLFVGNAIVPRIAGPLEGPNQLAGYYQIAIAAVGAWTMMRRRPLLDVALAACVCADVLTFSRAGLFGLLVVAAVFAACRGRAALRALGPALCGLVAGTLTIGWWALYAHTANVLRISLEESAYAGGVGNRGELWGAALRMWLRHPWIGVGAGNYELELADYGVSGVRTHANSWFLQSLAEGGIVLFAATLALAATVVGTLARALRRFDSPWILAAFAASVALIVHQVADYLVFYPKIGGSWWLLIGLAAAAAAAAESRDA